MHTLPGCPPLPRPSLQMPIHPQAQEKSPTRSIVCSTAVHCPYPIPTSSSTVSPSRHGFRTGTRLHSKTRRLVRFPGLTRPHGSSCTTPLRWRWRACVGASRFASRAPFGYKTCGWTIRGMCTCAWACFLRLMGRLMAFVARDRDVHPFATLTRIYFENTLCLSPLISPTQDTFGPKRTQVGVRVSLGDTGTFMFAVKPARLIIPVPQTNPTPPTSSFMARRARCCIPLPSNCRPP